MSKNQQNSIKPPKRIFFTGLWKGYDYKKNLIYSLLAQKYDLVIDEENPDYLIYSCFDDSHFDYDCIKIYYMGENVTPDFNLTDYALGFDPVVFGDRFFRMPEYRHHLKTADFALKPHEFYVNEAKNKSKFCNFIYSNVNGAAPERETFFDLLSQSYRQVDSGGRHRNNVGGPVDDKIAWQRGYKFSIAFENSSKSGYLTEKIIDCLKALTVPIYWGDPDVAKELNPERFINCHAFDSFEDVVNEVKRIDNDDAAYLHMLSRPWFENPPLPAYEDPALKEWLYHIFDQDITKARRTTRYGWTKYYYSRLSRRHRRSKRWYRRLIG